MVEGREGVEEIYLKAYHGRSLSACVQSEIPYFFCMLIRMGKQLNNKTREREAKEERGT